MDDFNPNINNDELSNEVTESEIIEELESSDDFVTDDESMWNRVEYTPDERIEDYKPMNKGLKVFCLVMSAVVALTATAIGGYFLGRSNVSTNNSYIGNNVTVGLEAKPVDTDASTPAQVYQMVNESIVGIRTYNEAGKAGDSSGVIYSADGYIVTNDHIYAEMQEWDII